MRDRDQNRWPYGNLSDPPRDVPLSVRIRLLLGGAKNQFGWFFFGFGLTFVWAFGGTEVLRDRAFFSGELAVCDGKITEMADTKVSYNERPVWKYRYAFSVEDTTYEGATDAFKGRFKVGDVVTIEYVVRNPARSRIKDVSFKSVGALFTAIFPIIGSVFVASGIRKGLKGGRLLRDGKQAIGTLISREATNTQVNDQTVYKYTFEFEADDGRRYEVTARTHLTDRFTGEDFEEPEEADDKASDEVIREPLLYTQYNPEDAVLLDDLPGGPRISERGEIPAVGMSLIGSLIIPGATVIGHGWWFLHVLEVL